MIHTARPSIPTPLQPLRSGRPNGFVLVTALVMLVALTLVAIFAMRNSGMEILMSENQILRVEALENSEFPRQALGEVVDQHALARGWPASLGGTLSDTLFDFEWPRGLVLVHEGATPDNWYVSNSECGPEGSCALPETLDRKARFDPADGEILTEGRPVASDLYVFKLRTDIASGAGAAMVSGYEGVGRAAAAGGGQVFFYLESASRSTRGVEGEGQARTASNYRHVIRN